jgi:dolichol-phosphate mannosyltransferase
MCLISIIAPVFNEETNITIFYQRCIGVFSNIQNKYEIIFVDDGSSDNTLKILKELASKDKNIRIISFSRNFGHQSAITAGLDFAEGDAVVIIDSDLQDPPELISQMIAEWKNNYQFVYAKSKKKKGETIFKKLQH